MPAPPRLALATPAGSPDPHPSTLAVLAGLKAEGRRVQHFATWARPTPVEAINRATGLPGRHLDDWLMAPEVCREVFARGARRADLAVVEGSLGDGPGAPGRLGPIAAILGLPLVALVDCRDTAGGHLPPLPRTADAVILDNLPDRDAFEPLRRLVAMVLKRPVLGGIEALPAARAALDGPDGEEALQALGASFLRTADLPP